MNDDPDRPQPDCLPGLPHPRLAPTVFGHDVAAKMFMAAYSAGRLHSGWLIAGPRGIGKATLAYKLAKVLLSQSVDSGFLADHAPPDNLTADPSNPDIRLVESGTHPRLKKITRVANEKTGKLQDIITVREIRKLKDFLHLSAPDGGRRVVIVDAADEMNSNAANAILKELEEPPADTTFLLIAHQPARLLPTIRSRCRMLRLHPLKASMLDQALNQLGIGIHETAALAALADGSVGEAIRLTHHDGLALYAELVALFEGLPNVDRPRALALAQSCVGRGTELRFDMVIGLLDRFLARAALAGLGRLGDVQASPGEARLFARIASGPETARVWAECQQKTGTRARQGRAVNLDPAALVLDMVFDIEQTAKATVPT